MFCSSHRAYTADLKQRCRQIGNLLMNDCALDAWGIGKEFCRKGKAERRALWHEDIMSKAAAEDSKTTASQPCMQP